MFLNDLERFPLNENNFGLNISDESIQGYLKLVVLLYADYIVLFAESEEALQQLLNEFQSYCVRWKLNVNPEKSKTVIFGHRSCPPYSFSFNKQPIEVVNNFKYFGVLLPKTRAERGSSIGCGRRFDPHIRQTFFRGDLFMKTFLRPISPFH